MGVQVLASVCIILWSAGVVSLWLCALKAAGVSLRVDVDAELLGLDFKYFDGQSTYMS